MKIRAVLVSALLIVAFSTASFGQGPPAGGNTAEEEQWQLVKESNDVELFEVFIKAYPQSRHAAEARARVAAAAPGPGVRAPLEPRSPAGTLFEHPRQGAPPSSGLRLDRCLHWGRDCDKPVADAFCRSQGFAAAAAFSTRVTGGPTWIMGDGQICSIPDCAALENVRCEGPGTPPMPPAQATFESPRINGIPLADCLYPSSGCGMEAALSFCRAAGFDAARSVGLARGVARTIHFGDRTVCSGQQCNAIAHIVCRRGGPT